MQYEHEYGKFHHVVLSSKNHTKSAGVSRYFVRLQYVMAEKKAVAGPVGVWIAWALITVSYLGVTFSGAQQQAEGARPRREPPVCGLPLL
jgi:hypothetical protein